VKFKENLSADTAPVATVKQLHWDVSSHGYLVPRVEIFPLDFGGATIKFASGYNARFVIDNKIEKGAKVALVRSGDIIPKILKVIKLSTIKVVAPKTFGDYAFDKTRVNLILLNPKENPTVRIKRLERFFSTLEIDFIKIGLVTKFYNAGFTNLSKILTATSKDFLKIEGVKDSLAQKLFDSIHSKIDKGVLLPVLMEASSMFPRGIGEIRLTAVDKSIGLEKLSKLDADNAVKRLSAVPGFSSITARQVVKGLPLFYKWLSIVKIAVKKQEYVSKSGKLKGLNFSFTGYRSKDEEAIIDKNGGSVIPFGSKTNYLLVVENGKASSKIDSAKEKGIKVITWKQVEKRISKIV
jgi:NAD-dependent DNA ligase